MRHKIIQASVSELRQGFVFNAKRSEYTCLFCNTLFIKGVIYTHNEFMVDGECAIKVHVQEAHGSTFEALLGLDKRYNGLSTIQKEILQLRYERLSDAAIAQKLGNKAQSTIRNHRFVLKEKYKEAKIFMALMEELFAHQDNPDEDNMVQFHSSLTVSDDRTQVTKIEQQEVLSRYFEEDALVHFPKKQKKKLIILQYIATKFEQDKKYTETEVNEILLPIYSDYVTIRRYLIEYGFLNRANDGSQYWVMN